MIVPRRLRQQPAACTNTIIGERGAGDACLIEHCTTGYVQAPTDQQRRQMQQPDISDLDRRWAAAHQSLRQLPIDHVVPQSWLDLLDQMHGQPSQPDERDERGAVLSSG